MSRDAGSPASTIGGSAQRRPSSGGGTFEGAGVSSGRWTLSEGAITFEPASEPSSLAFKLAGASAVPSGGALVLASGGTQSVLARSGDHLEQAQTTTHEGDAGAPIR